MNRLGGGLCEVTHWEGLTIKAERIGMRVLTTDCHFRNQAIPGDDKVPIAIDTDDGSRTLATWVIKELSC